MLFSTSNGRRSPCFLPLPVVLRFEDQRPKAELFEQLLRPLLTKGSRDDQKDPAFALSPPLRDHQTGLNGLSEAHLVSENRASRNRRLKREQRRIDLMRVHLDARGRQRLANASSLTPSSVIRWAKNWL